MKDTFSREEVIALVDQAFWEGIEGGAVEYGAESWIADDFITANTSEFPSGKTE